MFENTSTDLYSEHDVTSLIFQHTWWDGWIFDATVDLLMWHQQPASPSRVDPIRIEFVCYRHRRDICHLMMIIMLMVYHHDQRYELFWLGNSPLLQL